MQSRSLWKSGIMSWQPPCGMTLVGNKAAAPKYWRLCLAKWSHFYSTLLLRHISWKFGNNILVIKDIFHHCSCYVFFFFFLPGAFSVALILVGPSPHESACIDFASLEVLSFWHVSLFSLSTFSNTNLSAEGKLKHHYSSSFPTKFPNNLRPHHKRESQFELFSAISCWRLYTFWY